MAAQSKSGPMVQGNSEPPNRTLPGQGGGIDGSALLGRDHFPLLAGQDLTYLDSAASAQTM